MRPAVKGRPRRVSANLGEIGPLAKHNNVMPCGGVRVVWWERKNSTAALWGRELRPKNHTQTNVNYNQGTGPGGENVHFAPSTAKC